MQKITIVAILSLIPSAVFAQPALPKKDVPLSPVVASALQTDKTAADRAAARQKAFQADRVKYDQTAKAMAKRLEQAGVDVQGFLAASKAFAEAEPTAKTQATVDAVNAKYAQPIAAALDKASGIPGLGTLLQNAQSGQPSFPGGDPVMPLGGTLGSSCCTTTTFQPPWEGLYSESDFGAAAQRPGPTTSLTPQIRSAIASAPHRLQRSGRRITVPADARTVRVDVTLDTSWVIGLSGLGYAHVWLGLDMSVLGAGSAAVCSAPHLEQDNQWTWAGGFLTLSDHRPGPRIVRSCTFTRNPTDPTEFSATVTASSDGTFFGFSGGYGDYFVTLGDVTVTTCQ